MLGVICAKHIEVVGASCKPVCLLQVMVTNKFFDYEREPMNEISDIRNRHFWSANLPAHTRKQIKRFNFVHTLLFIFAIPPVVFINITPDIFKKFMFYDDHFPFWYKIVYKIGLNVIVAFGYFVTTAHECQFAYNILHLHFQMLNLRRFLTKEMGRYKKMPYWQKIHSSLFQSHTRDVLKCCIDQFSVLKTLSLLCLTTPYF